MGVYSRRYLLVHGAFMAAVLCLLAWYGLSPGRALAKWDGVHYLQIARSGYDHKLTFLHDGRPSRMDIAFFPLYPLLMRLTHVVTRLPIEVAGLLVSLLASLATAVGLGVLFEPLYGRRAALMTVTLWAVGIDAIVQSMLYGQSLIAAFVVWGVIAVRRRRFLLAGAAAFSAGLTHSTGLGLIVTVMVGAALAIREDLRRNAWRAAAAPAAACVLAPLGLLGYIVFLALRFHRADAWFLAESAPGWNSGFDAGRYTLSVLAGQLDGRDWHTVNGIARVVATVMLLPTVVVGVWLLYDAEWWPYLAARWPLLRTLTSTLPARLRRSPGLPALPATTAPLTTTPLDPPLGNAPLDPPPTPVPTPDAYAPFTLVPPATTPDASASSPDPATSADAATSPTGTRSGVGNPRFPRIPWELTLASLVTLAITLGDSGPWNSKPRFLIPCLALFVPPALWLERLERPDLRPRFRHLRRAIVLGAAIASLLCSFYMDGPSPAAL
jgi:hypothetical protein